MCSVSSHFNHCTTFGLFVLFGLQSDETDGRAASDDDFQNESTFACRKPTAERQQVQQGKAKVCVAAGGSTADPKPELLFIIYPDLYITVCSELHVYLGTKLWKIGAFA